ncbi:MAG: hypothetical protein ACXVI3_00235 [Halobacteriota archaeon]
MRSPQPTFIALLTVISLIALTVVSGAGALKAHTLPANSTSEESAHNLDSMEQRGKLDWSIYIYRR